MVKFFLTGNLNVTVVNTTFYLEQEIQREIEEDADLKDSSLMYQTSIYDGAYLET